MTSTYLNLWKISTLITVFIFGCQEKQTIQNRKVEIRKVNNEFVLYRHGKPYYIKGAGGYTNLEKLKAYGGNSVRIWTSDNAQEILDEANRLGLSVTLGLDVGRERLGFDYDDDQQVKKQFEKLKQEVIKYKDHPALLIWAVGNEVDQLGTNKKVWNAVNDIASMIHEVDPHHPTTTVIVPHREKILTVKRKCPEIDILSINTFDELAGLAPKLNEWIWGWNGAYLVTEWGSTGWWEAQRTAWDAAIEPTSTQKATLLKKHYQLIKKDKSKCIGSYVFYWGAKQERTPTWFSLFSEKGEETEGVHSMNCNWNETEAGNEFPKIKTIYLNNKTAGENIFINGGSDNIADVSALVVENDTLIYRWEIMEESSDLNGGGDWEAKPVSHSQLIKNNRNKTISFKAPQKEGPFRLFVYVYNNKNQLATANIPFYVIP